MGKLGDITGMAKLHAKTMETLGNMFLSNTFCKNCAYLFKMDNGSIARI
jgi:hypothetical protein